MVGNRSSDLPGSIGRSSSPSPAPPGPPRYPLGALLHHVATVILGRQTRVEIGDRQGAPASFNVSAPVSVITAVAFGVASAAAKMARAQKNRPDRG